MQPVTSPVRFGAIVVKEFNSAASMYAANTMMKVKLTDEHLDSFRPVVDQNGEVEFFIDDEMPAPGLSVSSPSLRRSGPNWWANNHFQWDNRTHVEKLGEFVDALGLAPIREFEDARPGNRPAGSLENSVRHWANIIKNAYDNTLLSLAVNKLKTKGRSEILDLAFTPTPDPS